MRIFLLCAIVIVLSSCQGVFNDEQDNLLDTHNQLNRELMEIQSVVTSNETKLKRLQNDTTETNVSYSDEVSQYMEDYETFLSRVSDNLNELEQVLLTTEKHSIALSYQDASTYIDNINAEVTSFDELSESKNLPESLENYNRSLLETNQELVATLQTLKRAIETNNMTDVRNSIETLNQLSNSY